MKSILKEKRIKLPQGEGGGLSSSVSGVRWAQPDQDLQTHNSAPSKSSTTPRQKDLRDLRTLQECVKFLNQWKQEVERVCKPGGGAVPVCSSSGESAAEPHSLEQCRKLILQWADELKNVNTLFNEFEERSEKEAFWETKENKADSAMEAEERIMEWAKELQTVSESCGVMREELAQTLRQLELKKKKLLTLLPFLEFVTWSLLKHDQGLVPQVWLLCKQRTWKTETPKYIPNSVWTWICSAAVDVSLDPLTNHRWLQVSDDRKRVQEALGETEAEFSGQRFDGWPCVLGWQGFSTGRHYWEVELANSGYWRLGVTTATSKRHGRAPMSPCQGFWVLWKSTRQFYACTKPETPLPLSLVPKRVGVYLDIEEGQVSFYNAESRSHIYTFTGHFKEKLYPLFAPLDGRTLMTLWSPENAPEL
ncbi:E3 ubiquitin-protein ligase TRIM39 [Astyanax mexicanus]|uniref:E3 ubiquitin-protein ligase TRIM39 n=1 Tax=Astyanax mexicanus TaxID=7994 RepID=UPI0020CAC019|nr:E3 ubiquitin-protein ligase TRIM39 [Astyanax mexicanus]XP_049339503.1 E3 ubiquitin-protein ligase TRIM39 [Astyanax mexicanus]